MMNSVGATAVTSPRIRPVFDGSVAVPSVRALRPAMTPPATTAIHPPTPATVEAVYFSSAHATTHGPNTASRNTAIHATLGSAIMAPTRAIHSRAASG